MDAETVEAKRAADHFDLRALDAGRQPGAAKMEIRSETSNTSAGATAEPRASPVGTSGSAPRMSAVSACIWSRAIFPILLGQVAEEGVDLAQGALDVPGFGRIHISGPGNQGARVERRDQLAHLGAVATAEELPHFAQRVGIGGSCRSARI